MKGRMFCGRMSVLEVKAFDCLFSVNFFPFYLFSFFSSTVLTGLRRACPCCWQVMSIQCFSRILLLTCADFPCCFTKWESICKGYGVRGDLNTTPASKPHIFKLHFVKKHFILSHASRRNWTLLFNCSSSRVYCSSYCRFLHLLCSNHPSGRIN